MSSNYETNGVLKTVSNVPVCNVASNLNSEQQALTTSAVASVAASAIDKNVFLNNYLKTLNDDRSDQENEDFSNMAGNNSRFKSNSNGYHCSNGGAIKRGCEVVDGENEDDLVTMSSSSSTGCLPPTKKTKFIVTSEEMNEFFKLLHHTEVQHFLRRDSCCLISDKYALAMVFTYFKRARFSLQEYTLEHFYLALYLASDIEEDVDEYKYEIFPWALGSSWRSNFSGFLRKRDALLRRIGYRAIVSRRCCEEVMSIKSEHHAWKRERAEDHGGATRAYLISRSKRFLSSKNNCDDDELNYPRLADEAPRPCALCLIKRGWDSAKNSICIAVDKQFINPNIIPRNKLANITNIKNNINSTNSSLISVTDGSINETLKITNSPRKKTVEGNFVSKRQKQTVSSVLTKECVASRSKSSLSSINSEKLTKPLNKTPKKSNTKTNLTIAPKFKHQQKQADEIDANLLKLAALDTTKELKLKTGSQLPSANKFNQIKLSTTELENNHRGFETSRRSSFASTEKLLIKDLTYEDYDEDNHSSYDEDDEDNNDDSTDEVFANNNDKLQNRTQIFVKKHENLRPNTRRCNATKNSNVLVPTTHGIRKRNNQSLGSSRNSSIKGSISTSTSSSKLELNMNSYDWLPIKHVQRDFFI